MAQSVEDAAVRSMRVDPGEHSRLAKRDPAETFGWTKPQAQAELEEVRPALAALQHRLYAESSRSVLVVLQAMDAAGKDGTIRHVMTGFNPAGVHVTSFKVPAGPEAAHDYLWRVHAACPPRGHISVFNRSHYEDVLVVRVKELVAEKRWRARYQHIREFERMLSDEGTSIVKIHLHISPDEQRERLQARLDDPEDRWKFRVDDLDDRKLWPQFTEAYQDAIAETTAAHAPWYVVPADRKWVRNLAVARILLDTLRRMDPRVPSPDPALEGLVIA